MVHPFQLSRASGYYFSEESACFSEIVVYFLALHRYNLSKKGVPYDGLRTAQSAFCAKRRRPQNRAGFGKRHCQAHVLWLRQAARGEQAAHGVFGSIWRRFWDGASAAFEEARGPRTRKSGGIARRGFPMPPACRSVRTWILPVSFIG